MNNMTVLSPRITDAHRLSKLLIDSFQSKGNTRVQALEFTLAYFENMIDRMSQSDPGITSTIKKRIEFIEKRKDVIEAVKPSKQA